MFRMYRGSFITVAAIKRNFGINSKSDKSETHYDVLQVNKNCSSEDIRNAFLKLSKKYHPDVKGNNADAGQTAQFVKISEAYQTLIKPNSRKQYDHILKVRNGATQTSNNEHVMRHNKIYRPWEIKPDIDPNPGPYYGLRTFRRISNLKLAFILAVFGFLSTFLGCVVLRYSLKCNLKKIDDSSAVASAHHKEVIANAKKYGNKEQLRRMLKRIRDKDT